jgi:hypothetical protein
MLCGPSIVCDAYNLTHPLIFIPAPWRPTTNLNGLWLWWIADDMMTTDAHGRQNSQSIMI